ncbi:hypothetical protein CB1_000539006 [Camelus ferus]|nr:hypothetical protein CB1_000539006 [Camelus ferus]
MTHFIEKMLNRFSEEVVVDLGFKGPDDIGTCWYILLSGSVFIKESMFLPRSRSVVLKQQQVRDVLVLASSQREVTVVLECEQSPPWGGSSVAGLSWELVAMTTAPQVCCACKSGFVVLGIGALVVSQQSSLKGKISGVSVCRVDLVPQGACRFQSSAREPVICGPCVVCGKRENLLALFTPHSRGGRVGDEKPLLRSPGCFGKRSAGSFRRGCECIVLEPSEMIVVDYMDENEEYFQRQASHRQSRRRFRKINQKGERQTIIDTVDPYPVGKPPLPRGYHTGCAPAAAGQQYLGSVLLSLEPTPRISIT